MSVAIAGVMDWHDISRETFINASSDIGISPQVIGREFDRLNGNFADAVYSAADELETSGLRHCREIVDAIMALQRFRFRSTSVPIH